MKQQNKCYGRRQTNLPKPVAKCNYWQHQQSKWIVSEPSVDSFLIEVDAESPCNANALINGGKQAKLSEE
ncbi:hypothetical protein [Pseudoalteromonas byunsanensis]|uniref:hypothetical protein n=1 Tax=Pseudoalteromonas byunsanensis TaxID=327939 RepID=UPI0011139EBC|nr:hypothetical protein [Pseudoalteromonas byunsanensis]